MPEIQMSLVQISSGCFSDLSGCINIIFNFLSEVEIFAILLNMEFAARTYKRSTLASMPFAIELF